MNIYFLLEVENQTPVPWIKMGVRKEKVRHR